ncbi:MAG: hypothetical protein E4G98_06685, partial [Promethearchaeota archaeon]
MNPFMKKLVEDRIGKMTTQELEVITDKFDTKYTGRNHHISNTKDYPQEKGKYVHRHILIREGCVNYNNINHRQMVSYFHPWMKGYLEKVEKALWSVNPLFCKPTTDKDEVPEEDEKILDFWEENRLQEACKKAWHKAQVHGIIFYYPMKTEQFFEGYSGPAWTIYSVDEMGEPSDFAQGHPLQWTINHSNPNKDEPKQLFLKQGVFYDYKNTDDFTGEPFGLGSWDVLIDWLWITDSVNAFDQRMGNGFLTVVVPNNTTPAEIAKMEDTIRNTRTEKGIVIKGSVEEPVTLNWVGMAGVQVDFISHLEKLEDLIAFNMGFPKRWIMGDAEGAMESSGKDALQVNTQLKDLFAEWVLYIKRVLLFHGQISSLKDIIIKPAFEMQLSEQEKLELEQMKALTIASKTWLSVNEQREADGMKPIAEEGADEVMLEQSMAKEEMEQGAEKPETDGKKPKAENNKPKADTYLDLANALTDNTESVNQLAAYLGVSPTTVSKMRAKMDADNQYRPKLDDLVMKCDAMSLGDDLWEIQDVPVVLPQTKFYEKYGYNSIRPREEIEKIFNDPAYPKEYRIGTTITDDHKSKVPLEILNENTVGMVQFKRLDEDGNIRADIRYSLSEADRILGKDNYIRKSTESNQNIPTSVALYSRDRPHGKDYIERDLDIRSFVFT